METIKDNFHHDIVHYTRHGQLSMETGVYDMEHRSAQELFLRNERRTKLMEELDAKKAEWPSILNGMCNKGNTFVWPWNNYMKIEHKQQVNELRRITSRVC